MKSSAREMVVNMSIQSSSVFRLASRDLFRARLYEYGWRKGVVVVGQVSGCHVDGVVDCCCGVCVSEG